MEICRVAWNMSLRDVAINPREFSNLALRVLFKNLGLGPRKFEKSQHVESPDLPQDVLMNIFATLEIPDLMRAGSVCSSWHSAYTSLRSLGQYKQNQTPCLLYTSESAGEDVACLYSLSEKRAYRLTLPEPPICSRYLIGSSYGWIVTADERSELHLVNPITGEQIALPSVTTIEQVKAILDAAGAVHKYEYSWYTGEMVLADSPSIFAPSELRDFLFYKAFLSSDPSMGDYFVVLIHNPHDQISFARSGDDKWTWLPPHSDYEDCFFKGGLLYAMTSFGEIHVCDLGTPAITQKIVVGKEKFYDSDRIYIVQASCGDLLQIWRANSLSDEEYDPDSDYELVDESAETNTLAIEVQKLELTAKRLVQISNLGDNVFFLGHNHSLCLCAEEYPQLNANHVYFTDDDTLYVFGSKNKRRDIGVFDLENKSSEEVVSPQLWSNWPSPVWLVPNPRKLNLASLGI